VRRALERREGYLTGTAYADEDGIARVTFPIPFPREPRVIIVSPSHPTPVYWSIIERSREGFTVKLSELDSAPRRVVKDVPRRVIDAKTNIRAKVEKAITRLKELRTKVGKSSILELKMWFIRRIFDPGHSHGVITRGHKHRIVLPYHSHRIRDPRHKHRIVLPWGVYPAGATLTSSEEATGISVESSGGQRADSETGWASVSIRGSGTGLRAEGEEALTSVRDEGHDHELPEVETTEFLVGLEDLGHFHELPEPEYLEAVFTVERPAVGARIDYLVIL